MGRESRPQGAHGRGRARTPVRSGIRTGFFSKEADALRSRNEFEKDTQARDFQQNGARLGPDERLVPRGGFPDF